MDITKNTIVVSGGFDPIHIGHVRMINEASKYGDVIVILNNDNWLKKKKGKVFMPEDERFEILTNLRNVSLVYLSKHAKNSKDMSVCNELKEICPTYFANGGDRKQGNIPESDVCNECDIIMLYNIGGDKIQSSSWLIEKCQK